ncbi:MAG: 7TMR-DISMED2 domain-containing protein, partial [Bacteroidales bacterium]
MKSVIFILLCFYTFTSVRGQTLFLTGSTTSYDVSKYLQYSVDSSLVKKPADIKSSRMQWQTFKDGQTPNLGINRQAYWFTFVMQNNTHEDEWMVHVDYQTLDAVSMFVYDTAGNLVFTDAQGILTKNLHKQRMPLFPLSLKINETVRVYFRVQTSSLLIFPVKVSTPMAFCSAENAQRNVYLPAWGILVAA